MSIAALYILDKKSNILIFRNYQGDLPSELVEKFALT